MNDFEANLQRLQDVKFCIFLNAKQPLKYWQFRIFTLQYQEQEIDLLRYCRQKTKNPLQIAQQIIDEYHL